MNFFIHRLYFGKTKPEITMPITIRKSGNANIVALPKALLEQLGVGIGDRFDVALQDDTIILSPSKTKVKRLTLEEILEGVTPETFQTEEDREWMDMRPVGKELL